MTNVNHILNQHVVESEVIKFLKDFIESRGFRKLIKVEQINFTPGIVGESYIVSLEGLVGFLSNSTTQKFTINTLSRFRNKKSEYLLNQEFSVFTKDFLDYYKKWNRDNQLLQILD